MEKLRGEEGLIKSLTWSDRSYLLEEFLHEYTLPQLIRVIQGHDSGTDITSLSHGEVLVLHCLTKTRILAGEDGHGHAIAIPLDSPYKLQVLPLLGDCRHRSCGVEELSSVFPKVKYVQVLQGDRDQKNDSDSASDGQIYEILNVDKRNKRAKVKVLATGRTRTLSFKCEALFTPVLDGKAGYFAKDLESHFGFPVRVRLLNTEDNESLKTERTDEDDPSGLLHGNVDVTIVEETDDILVVATTAGDNVRCKFCYEVPRELQVRVQTVDQTFREQNEDYCQSLVANFDQLTSNLPKSGHFTRRGAIIGHSYEAIEKLFHNRPKGYGGKGNNSPALPPRDYPPSSSKNRSLSSEQNSSMQRNWSVKNKEIKRGCPLKPRSASAPVDPDTLKMRPRMSPKSPPRTRLVPKEPSSVNNEPISVSCITTSKDPLSYPGVLNLSEGEESLRSRHLVASELQTPSSDDPAGSPSIPNVLESSYKHGALKPGSIPTSHLSELPSKDPGGSQSIPLSTSERSYLYPEQVSDRQLPDVPPKLSRRPPSIRTKPIGSSTVIHEKSTPSPSKEHFSNQSDGCSDIPPKLPLRQLRIRASPMESPTNTHEQSETRFSRQRFSEKTKGNNDYLAPMDIFDSQTNGPPLESRTKNCPAVIDNELGEDVYEEVNFLEHRNRGSSGSRGHMEGWYMNISKVPMDLSCLTVKEVSQLLKDLHMECYVETFEEELIDGGLLGKLKKDDLESLNVKSFHITKLLEFISGWRPK